MGFVHGRPMPERRHSRPEPDPSTATPEQVVEYYRDEPLFRDITERLDHTVGTDHHLNPEAELVRTTEAFAERLKQVRKYLEKLETGAAASPLDPARQPAEDFVAALEPSRGRGPEWPFVNAALVRREYLIGRARLDAQARFEEYQPKR